MPGSRVGRQKQGQRGLGDRQRALVRRHNVIGEPGVRIEQQRRQSIFAVGRVGAGRGVGRGSGNEGGGDAIAEDQTGDGPAKDGIRFAVRPAGASRGGHLERGRADDEGVGHVGRGEVKFVACLGRSHHDSSNSGDDKESVVRGREMGGATEDSECNGQPGGTGNIQFKWRGSVDPVNNRGKGDGLVAPFVGSDVHTPTLRANDAPSIQGWCAGGHASVQGRAV